MVALSFTAWSIAVRRHLSVPNRGTLVNLLVLSPTFCAAEPWPQAGSSFDALLLWSCWLHAKCLILASLGGQG